MQQQCTPAAQTSAPVKAIDPAAVAALQRRISAFASVALTDAPYSYHR